MTTDLATKHRPRKIEDVVGQAGAVRQLQSFGMMVPHVILFEGPSGVGKTTLARALSRELGCEPDPHSMDYQEVNCASIESPLQTVQRIEDLMTGQPMVGKCRVWVLDEVQSLSRARFAQEGLLKVLEEVPSHVYFFLCTTDPKKVLPTVLSRCQRISCRALTDKELADLVRRVAKAEKRAVASELVDRIVAAAEGSGRTALKQLEKCLAFEGADDQMKAVERVGASKVAFDLVRALLPFQGDPRWPEAVKVLRDCKSEDPEGIRQLLLAAARTTLLNEKNQGNAGLLQKAVRVIDYLRDPLWDRNSGHALLAAYIYGICYGK